MRELRLQNKDGTELEVIKLPNWGFDKVWAYAKELEQQIKEDESDNTLTCLFG